MPTSSIRYELLDLALEWSLLPDAVLRAGSLCGAWAREHRESRGGVSGEHERLRALVARISSGPIAEVPERANEQQYELPAEFLALILGPADEVLGVSVACGRRLSGAGCGWGSLSLWLAERYPSASVVGVSNSAGQRQWIEAERDRRLTG